MILYEFVAKRRGVSGETPLEGRRSMYGREAEGTRSYREGAALSTRFIGSPGSPSGPRLMNLSRVVC